LIRIVARNTVFNFSTKEDLSYFVFLNDTVDLKALGLLLSIRVVSLLRSALTTMQLILTAHIHISATRQHKSDANKSACEVFYWEIDFASFAHLQSPVNHNPEARDQRKTV